MAGDCLMGWCSNRSRAAISATRPVNEAEDSGSSAGTAATGTGAVRAAGGSSPCSAPPDSCRMRW